MHFLGPQKNYVQTHDEMIFVIKKKGLSSLSATMVAQKWKILVFPLRSYLRLYKQQVTFYCSKNMWQIFPCNLSESKRKARVLIESVDNPLIHCFSKNQTDQAVIGPMFFLF